MDRLVCLSFTQTGGLSKGLRYGRVIVLSCISHRLIQAGTYSLSAVS